MGDKPSTMCCHLTAGSVNTLGPWFVARDAISAFRGKKEVEDALERSTLVCLQIVAASLFHRTDLQVREFPFWSSQPLYSVSGNAFTCYENGTLVLAFEAGFDKMTPILHAHSALFMRLRTFTALSIRGDREMFTILSEVERFVVVREVKPWSCRDGVWHLVDRSSITMRVCELNLSALVD